MTLDNFIKTIDRHLRVWTGVVSEGARPLPEKQPSYGQDTPYMDKTPGDLKVQEKERRHAARLMRVNHVGEICAQALYQAQKKATRSESLRSLFEKAANEEEDHLNWTAQRLKALGTHPSLLNPFWYGGAFMIGWISGFLGDAWSLGIMAETERQVEQHLIGHLQQWPTHDVISIALLEQMIADEIAHGQAALHAGGVALPWVVRGLMRIAARVMTSTAYYI